MLADKLDRKSIFEAAYKRHCYGTSGARIFVDVGLNSGDKKIAIMGDIVSKNSDMSLSIEAMGTAPIEKIDIFNRDKITKTYLLDVEKTDKKYIKFVWEGAKNKGRDRSKEWSGQIVLPQSNIRKSSIETVNFLNEQSSFDLTKNKIEFKGKTRGNRQGLIVPMVNKNSAIKILVNGKKISINLSAIGKKPKEYIFDGLDAKFSVYQTTANVRPKHLEFLYKLPKLKKGLNSILVRITQRDGHLAWTSPIFIKN